jgi:hypothetical protein
MFTDEYIRLGMPSWPSATMEIVDLPAANRANPQSPSVADLRLPGDDLLGLAPCPESPDLDSPVEGRQSARRSLNNAQRQSDNATRSAVPLIERTPRLGKTRISIAPLSPRLDRRENSPKLIRRKPVKHDMVVPRQWGKRSVTVCIAARAGGLLIGASDRMLTSGDIEFEPNVSSKIVPVTPSIMAMSAGDASFNAEITLAVNSSVTNRKMGSPNLFPVKDAADLFVEGRSVIKQKRASTELLSPLGLTLNEFMRSQRDMDSNIVENLTRDLINYDVPNTSTIVLGIDATGPHIYIIDDGNVRCNDSIGFAAIGIGARHAESQFMLQRHSWNSSLVDALLLTYVAKKRSEVAPGVGKGTDMFIVQPAPVLGNVNIVGITPDVIERLDQIYQSITESERRSLDDARQQTQNFVTEVQAKARKQLADRERGAFAGGGDIQVSPPTSFAGEEAKTEN